MGGGGRKEGGVITFIFYKGEGVRRNVITRIERDKGVSLYNLFRIFPLACTCS